jgi:hypothetical protein
MGWGVAILPYLDQGNLYKQYDPSKYSHDAANQAVVGTPLAVMNCPSDPFAGRVVTNFQGLYPKAATGSYKGVAGKDTWNSYFNLSWR